MSLIFREVSPKDMEGFCILMEQLSERPESMELLKGQIEKAQKNPDMYLMLAEQDGKAVGSLIGLICEDFCGACRPILFIENVVTLAACRGQGVGRKMFEAIEAWGQTRNCSYAVLVSSSERIGAHKFYHALGYSEEKGFKKYL